MLPGARWRRFRQRMRRRQHEAGETCFIFSVGGLKHTLEKWRCSSLLGTWACSWAWRALKDVSDSSSAQHF